MDRDSCRRTARYLDAFLDGTLPESVRRELDEHAAGCADCRRLLKTVRESAAALREPVESGAPASAATGPDLIAGVLARTSGPACPRAEWLLPARSEGALATADRELLSAHLEHCRACRKLAATLDWIVPLLPELAELAPDPATAAALLARTRPLLRRRARLRRITDLAGSVRRNLRSWWQRWWHRPRFALEAAYVVMLLIIALMGTPVSPLKEVPGQALSVVRAGPLSGSFASEFATTVPGRAIAMGADFTDRVGQRVTGTVDRVAGHFERRGRAAQPAWQQMTRHASTAVDQGRTGRWPEALREIDAAGTALGEAWSRWWRNESDDENDQTRADNEGGGSSGSRDPLTAGRS